MHTLQLTDIPGSLFLAFEKTSLFEIPSILPGRISTTYLLGATNFTFIKIRKCLGKELRRTLLNQAQKLTEVLPM